MAALLAWPCLATSGDGFYAGTLSLVPAAAATDVFTITGSATRRVVVNAIAISATQNTLGTVAIQMLKRSTADSGGTSSTLAPTPRDSTSAAATAVVRAYTVSPTSLGNQVGGPVMGGREIIPAINSAVASARREYNFYSIGLPIVLNGTAEQLVVNFNGATVVGGNLSLQLAWTEE